MTIGNSVVRYQGKEYVTISEFSSRFGASIQHIRDCVRKGILKDTKINGYRAAYLDWVVESVKFENYTKYRMKIGNGRKPDLTAFLAKEPKAPTIKEEKAELPTVEAPSAPEIPSDIVNMSTLNPQDYPDCWIRDAAGEVLMNEVTKLPELDYDRLKQRLTAEKFQLDIDQKRGKFIERDELTRSIVSIANIINAGLAAIPQRYGAILIAEAERITGHEFTADERASIRKTLKNEAGNIMNSIRTEIDNMRGDDAKEEGKSE